MKFNEETRIMEPEPGYQLRLGDIVYTSSIVLGKGVDPASVIEELRELTLEERIATLEEIVTEKMTEDELNERVFLFDDWESLEGELKEGRVVRYGDKLYKVQQTHLKQDDWNPEGAVSLFDPIRPPKTVLPWEQPQGTLGLYHKGDKVLRDGKVWVSIADNNSWAPGVYGWEVE